MSKLHPVCPASELPPGGRRIVEVGKISIGVFNVGGEFHALRNVCPHQLAPLCLGRVTGTTAFSAPGAFHWEREGCIIRCPWHGWEFDLRDGRSVFNPHRLRVRTYPVSVEPGAEDVDPTLDTYPVSVADGMVCLHLP